MKNIDYVADCYRISKNPTTQNYITVMNLFGGGLHNFLTIKFWDLEWKSKIEILSFIANSLGCAHEKNLAHSNLYKWYLILMYQYWSDDPSERPTADELSNLFGEISDKLNVNIVDNNVMRQFKIVDENQKKIHQNLKNKNYLNYFHIQINYKFHPQSSYISRYIYTLHGLHHLLEEIKSGKTSWNNLF
ncbi:hypothetical protein Glove_527g3 [Diversispora epigaea]|uniref:Protein kinase domain-containing protein n=1 Tax=Diversispora epigaea TaxID=1348612 RepID=A0A397GJK2_9GLOM|nr:hypothetical protein Glove_527g3 [Diversispora epigaea]